MKASVHLPPRPTATGTAMTLCGDEKPKALSEVESYIDCKKCLEFSKSVPSFILKKKPLLDLNFLTLQESRAFRLKVLKQFKGDFQRYSHCGKTWKVSKKFKAGEYLCPICGKGMKPELIVKRKGS